MNVLHEERVHVLDSLKKVIKACEPILRRGSSPALRESVASALAEAENRRSVFLLDSWALLK